MTPFEQLQAILDYVPEPQPEDPAWKSWHLRPGDMVEVTSGPTFGRQDCLGIYEVTAASSRHFKITDRRVFAQSGGYPLVTGKKSPIRARRAR